MENNNSNILEILIREDFGFDTKDESRWGKSTEHDSLVLDKKRGIFFWNSQGIVGDPLVYLTNVRKYSFSDAKDYLDKFSYIGTHVYTIHSGKNDVVVYPKLVEVFYEDGLGEEKRDYLYRRGFTDETIDRFQIGWYNGFSMIPFFEDGTFRNFQMRRDMPVKTIRAYYKGVGALLYNAEILNLVNRVYYTEGPLDALILLQNGLPAVSSNSGGGYRPEWYNKFTRQDFIYLLFDNDDAGEKEAKRLARFLGVTRCKIYCFWEFEEKGYDPVDFFRDGHTIEELKLLVKEKSKYEFELN